MVSILSWWVESDGEQARVWHLCWFYKHLLPAPIKHHPHQLPTHPKAISPGLAPPSDNHSCDWISALSPSSLATDDTSRFTPACFCLALCGCRRTARSALSAITEKTEEAVAWFSRLWGLPSSIIFLPVMIYAACVNAHVCASRTFLSFLLVCISGSFPSHANSSSFLLSEAPDIKVHNTRCFYTHWLRVLKSWLHDRKMKAKLVLDSLHAALVK